MGSFNSLKSLISLALAVILYNFTPSVHAYGKLEDMSEFTELQKHVSFFDRNKDGLIYPSEIYQGFIALGVNKSTALSSAESISGLLGPITQPGNRLTTSSQLLPIYVENIKKATRPNILSAFDGEGRFVPSNFEGIFTKYAKTNPNSLAGAELMELVKDVASDKTNPFAPNAWKSVYGLFKDENGLLQKDALRDLYDGTLFYNREKEIGSSANVV